MMIGIIIASLLKEISCLRFISSLFPGALNTFLNQSSNKTGWPTNCPALLVAG